MFHVSSRYWFLILVLTAAAAVVSIHESAIRSDSASADTRDVDLAGGFAAGPAEAISNADAAVTVSSTPEFIVSKDDLYEVLSVVDGDTIVVDLNGVKETVRLIGVDTPETVHPSKPVQCFGTEASARTKNWLTDRKIVLVGDPSQGARDKYGRLLAYVRRDDGLFVNRELISEGFAFEYTYNLPYEYQAEFKAAEAAAREGKKGLWADEACAESLETIDDTSTFLLANPDDKDCPDFATQAAAQAYFEAGGGSPIYNFDRLDSDHDGIACESLP